MTPSTSTLRVMLVQAELVHDVDLSASRAIDALERAAASEVDLVAQAPSSDPAEVVAALDIGDTVFAMRRSEHFAQRQRQLRRMLVD